MFDGSAFGAEMVSIVRSFVERSLEPLAKANADLAERNAVLETRVAALEARDIPEAFDPAPLQDGIAAISRVLDALPSFSGMVTKAEVDEVRAMIPTPVEPADVAAILDAAAVKAREIAEMVTRAAIEAIPEAKDFGPEIGAVREAIPEPFDPTGLATTEELAAVRGAIPDVSGFATKADVSEAIGAIVIPEAINGKDADPEAVAAIVMEKIAPSLHEVDTELADAVKRIDARLAEVKDGEPGKDGFLPLAETWTDRVFLRGAVVTHGGALWQATEMTGKEPPHADWRCLAAKGEDGRTPEFIGTYEAEAEFRRLDVVALNGGSFVALRDNPGPCPGDGWQLLAGRGKPGPSVKGDKGDKGEPGNDAAEVVGFYRSGDEIVATFADGRELRA